MRVLVSSRTGAGLLEKLSTASLSRLLAGKYEVKWPANKVCRPFCKVKDDIYARST